MHEKKKNPLIGARLFRRLQEKVRRDSRLRSDCDPSLQSNVNRCSHLPGFYLEMPAVALQSSSDAAHVPDSLAMGLLDNKNIANEPCIREEEAGQRHSKIATCRVVKKQRASSIYRLEPLDKIFFFSSRRRHTRYIGDWSSDVCSSDLHRGARKVQPDIGCRTPQLRRPFLEGDSGAPGSLRPNRRYPA